MIRHDTISPMMKRSLATGKGNFKVINASHTCPYCHGLVSAADNTYGLDQTYKCNDCEMLLRLVLQGTSNGIYYTALLAVN